MRALPWLALVLAACAVSPPEGTLRCDPSTPCPPDFVCRTDHLCWHGAGALDAGLDAPRVDGAIDGAIDAAGSDAFQEDAFAPDARDAATPGGDTDLDAGTDAWAVDGGLADGGCGVVACTPGSVAEITAGTHHTCALLADGRVQCFGRNDLGQLGDGSAGADRFRPLDVVGLTGSRVLHVDAQGGLSTCAVTADGHAHCWGYLYRGGLGDGRMESAMLWAGPSPVPSSVVGLTDASHVAGRCAWNAAGLASCWGQLALGNGATAIAYTPTDPVGGLASPIMVQDITFGVDYACGIVGANARCWGWNSTDLAADPIGVANTTVLFPTTGMPARIVSALTNHTCVVNGGRVTCWGHNAEGQCGAAASTTAAPTDVTVAAAGTPLLDGTAVLALGGNSLASCALMATQRVLCWGTNANGAAGLSASFTGVEYRARPVLTAAGAPLDHVVAITNGGTAHTCVLRDDGHVWCWGDNTHGQLGRASTTMFLAAADDVGSYPAVASVCGITGAACTAADTMTCDVCTNTMPARSEPGTRTCAPECSGYGACIAPTGAASMRAIEATDARLTRACGMANGMAWSLAGCPAWAVGGGDVSGPYFSLGLGRHHVEVDLRSTSGTLPGFLVVFDHNGAMSGTGRALLGVSVPPGPAFTTYSLYFTAASDCLETWLSARADPGIEIGQQRWYNDP